MKQNKCLVVEDKKFLWWKWKSRYYDHDWAYRKEDDVLYRKCLKCGEIEFTFEINRMGYIWRKSL